MQNDESTSVEIVFDGGPRPSTALAERRPAVRDRVAARWLLSKHSENTQAAYRRDIGTFFDRADECDIDVLSAEQVHLDGYRRWLETAEHRGRVAGRTSLAPVTVARKLTTVSSFYSHATRTGAALINPDGPRRPPEGVEREHDARVVPRRDRPTARRGDRQRCPPTGARAAPARDRDAGQRGGQGRHGRPVVGTRPPGPTGHPQGREAAAARRARGRGPCAPRLHPRPAGAAAPEHPRSGADDPAAGGLLPLDARIACRDRGPDLATHAAPHRGHARARRGRPAPRCPGATWPRPPARTRPPDTTGRGATWTTQRRPRSPIWWTGRRSAARSADRSTRGRTMSTTRKAARGPSTDQGSIPCCPTKLVGVRTGDDGAVPAG